MVFSADDEYGRPNERLLGLALDSANRARNITLKEISARMPFPPYYPELWPGEHYRLLAAVVEILAPRTIIEIGTGSGLSALTMQTRLQDGGKLITFDVTPWQSMPGTQLREADFEKGDLMFYSENLADPLSFPLYLDILKKADLIFVDAAKDGALEDRLMANFSSIPFDSPPLVIMDDIRLWNMLRTWREIRRPKLDVTSFGHWSGTGFVDWIPMKI
jgi:predicted O-methyltransferase YrrM